MTMPHLMNCPHSDDSWCLDCVKQEWDRTYSEIATLTARLAAAEAREQKDIAELQRLNRECVALLKRLAAAEAAARWLWPKVSDDAYDAAWDKWPWLDSESAKGGRDE